VLGEADYAALVESGNKPAAQRVAQALNHDRVAMPAALAGPSESGAAPIE
jgi:hypothetical protein